MSDFAAPVQKLDIGQVVKDLFAVLGRNFPTFFILALVLTGIPTAILYGVQGSLLKPGGAGLGGPQLISTVVGGIVAGLSGLILQGTIIYGTVGDLNGRKMSVADSLRAGLNAFLPLLLLGILMGLAIAVGMVLLVVPGIMLAVAWCVAVPAFVVERPDLMASFGRSAELTRGNRWRIFGMFCLLLIAVIVIEIVVGVAGAVTNVVTLGGFPLVTRLFVLPLINVASGLLGAVGSAVLYVELRRLKDGVGAEGLAAIFD